VRLRGVELGQALVEASLLLFLDGLLDVGFSLCRSTLHALQALQLAVAKAK